MVMNLKKCFFIIVVLLLTGFKGEHKSPSKQVKFFDVIYKGEKVGILRAEKQFSKRGVSYKSTTKIRTKILLFKKINVRHAYKVLYRKGELDYSKVSIKINDRAPENISILQNDVSYNVLKDRQHQFSIKSLVSHSTILLYFQEPSEVRQTLSENTGHFNDLSMISKGTYKKTNEKGRENIYYYENGELLRVEVDGGLIKFEIQAR